MNVGIFHFTSLEVRDARLGMHCHSGSIFHFLYTPSNLIEYSLFIDNNQNTVFIYFSTGLNFSRGIHKVWTLCFYRMYDGGVLTILIAKKTDQ